MNSDKSAIRSVFAGRYLAVLDLKTSCRTYRLVCDGPTVGQINLSKLARASTNHEMSWLVATKNRLVRSKLMARQILIRFDCDKISATLRRKNRLMCGSFNMDQIAGKWYNSDVTLSVSTLTVNFHQDRLADIGTAGRDIWLMIWSQKSSLWRRLF